MELLRVLTVVSMHVKCSKQCPTLGKNLEIPALYWIGSEMISHRDGEGIIGTEKDGYD